MIFYKFGSPGNNVVYDILKFNFDVVMVFYAWLDLGVRRYMIIALSKGFDQKDFYFLLGRDGSWLETIYQFCSMSLKPDKSIAICLIFPQLQKKRI